MQWELITILEYVAETKHKLKSPEFLPELLVLAQLLVLVSILRISGKNDVNHSLSFQPS